MRIGPSYCLHMTVLSSRYEVTRRGTPDPPNAAYVVLDVVNDFEARWLTQLYIRALHRVGNTTRADELSDGLQRTSDAHQKAMGRNNTPAKSKTK